MTNRWNRWASTGSASLGSLGNSAAMSPIPIIDNDVGVVPSPVRADDSPMAQDQGTLVNVDRGPSSADDCPMVRGLVPQL